jgi:hypothetical protein
MQGIHAEDAAEGDDVTNKYKHVEIVSEPKQKQARKWSVKNPSVCGLAFWVLLA